MKMNADPTIENVRQFWDANPLFFGEASAPTVDIEWFEQHRQVVIGDGYAGRFDERILPPAENQGVVLDLGCGPGFWTVELMKRSKIKKMYAVDLTARALEITKKRLSCYGLQADVLIENAEQLSFANASFDHVNCQGVIHHTPNTEAAVAEIARILRSGGTASLSVYYRNIVLRHWAIFSWMGRFLALCGAKLSGRGRENIYRQRDVNEIVRLYDGFENPIGKSYTRAQLLALLRPHFHVERVFFHFFPARSLPFPIPQLVHRALDVTLPFMIFVNVRKP